MGQRCKLLNAEQTLLLRRFDIQHRPASAATRRGATTGRPIHDAPQRPCHGPAVFYLLAFGRRRDKRSLLWLGVELQASMRSRCAPGRIAWWVLTFAFPHAVVLNLNITRRARRSSPK